MEHGDESQSAEGDLNVVIKGEDEISGERPPNPRASRKRTKTGCLTCRRRRIKCGEERPRCVNCIKSKRQCEGYNQRVIFKEPVNSFRYPSSAAPVNMTPKTEPSTSFRSASRFQFQRPPPHPGALLSRNALRPNDSMGSQEFRENTAYSFSGGLNENVGQIFFPPSDVSNRRSDTSSHFYDVDIGRSSEKTQIHGNLDPQARESRHESNVGVESELEKGSNLDRPQFPRQWTSDPYTEPAPAFQEQVYHSEIRDPAPSIQPHLVNMGAKWPLYAAHSNEAHSQPTSSTSSRRTNITDDNSGWLPDADRTFIHKGPEVTQVYKTTFQDANKMLHAEWDKPQKKPVVVVQEQGMVIDNQMTNRIAVAAQDWSNNSDDDDDPYDITDDESREEEHLNKNDLGIVVALQAAQDRQDQTIRTYHSFIDSYGPEALANYRPSPRSSPLNDSMTARIFCHFINVTAPCISMFERHPANPSLIFQGRPVPKSQQHIWTYTMPTLALGNQALLQAILALGSLHMAKLEDGPIMAPLKHYHLALRRIGKAVSLPTRRGQPAILAATMLLGWFEIMSADHSKWTGHLLGAKLLLQGIDFSGMAKYLKTKKMRLRLAQFRGQSHQDRAFVDVDDFHPDQGESLQYLPKDDDVNESLVSIIMGKKLQYDQYGEVLEDINTPKIDEKVYTQRDIETYETQRDLFWWYCKQDSTQSILGGTKLLMPFDLWSHCPPRAAVGRRDAIYGTWDHLLLLLGRLAEFSAKDLRRKRSALKAGMGPPGMRPPGGVPPGVGPRGEGTGLPGMRPPGGETGVPGGGPPGGPPPQGMQQLPSFAGMLPGAGGKIPLPRGFSPPREQSPDDMDSDDRTIEEQTSEALEEWQEIHSAFNTLRDNFGPDYQALGPEYSQPIQTPFGPALQFRTFGIAGIWMSYYLGLIVLHRGHPFMPPAAMAAVGAAARQTGHYANEIGRIAAAIAPNASQIEQVNTGIGAALIESSFPLFVAGVQFQDSAQRSWTIRRCFDMRRLTGWQTAHSVAIGCETSWKRAAEFGSGPPYTRGPEWQETLTALDLSSRREQILWGANAAQSENSTDNTQNRVHYALGLLAVEADLRNLAIQDRDGP